MLGFKYQTSLRDAIICIVLCGAVSNGFNSSCSLQNSTVSCEGINDVEIPITDHINQILQPNLLQIQLNIEKTFFESATLKRNWLSTLDKNTKITVLTLRDCILSNIEKGAFLDHPFEMLSTLLIVNSGLTTLKQDMFEGLYQLHYFAFRTDIRTYELKIEKQALEKIGSFLESVEINCFKISTESLQNLFGINGKHCPQLKSLDLRFNDIETIPENAFMKAFQVEAIYLESNGILEIHERAFSANTLLKKLQLSNNSLKKLESNTFRNLQNLGQGSLYLNGNDWHCNCDLEWLKDMYTTGNVINKEVPLKCSNGTLFQDFDFCSATEVTTDFQTTTIPELPATLQCKIINSSLPLTENIDATHVVDIVIKNVVVTLKFQELQCEPLQVKIIVINTRSDLLHNYFLLWINSNNKSERGCITPINNNTLINNLNRATTYTFSLVKQNETKILPHHLFGFTTLTQWSQRPWILNNKKSLVLGLISFSMFFLGVLVLILAFLHLRMRRKETAHKSNASKDDYSYVESAVSTKKYEKPEYWEPYVAPSNQGYLTPKRIKYQKVRCRPSITRSISDCSMCTTSAFYDENTNKNTDVWSSSQYNKRSSYHQNATNCYYEFKPPLPPLNSQIRQ